MIDLMNPRYEVISDYPESKNDVGDILHFNHSDGGFENEGYYKLSEEFFKSTDNVFLPGVVEKNPTIFRKLGWWELRTIEQMPEYVKQTGMVDFFGQPIPDSYLKVKEHFKSSTGNWRDNSIHIFHSYDRVSRNYFGWEPATEEEYIQSKTV